MHTINQRTWLLDLLAKQVYLADQAVLVFTDMQVKLAQVAVQAYLNAIFYVYVMAVHMIAVMALQVHHWHSHHAY
jgi:uncharacterized membrane protein YecN with MAPEG domain